MSGLISSGFEAARVSEIRAGRGSCALSPDDALEEPAAEQARGEPAQELLRAARQTRGVDTGVHSAKRLFRLGRMAQGAVEDRRHAALGGGAEQPPLGRGAQQRVGHRRHRKGVVGRRIDVDFPGCSGRRAVERERRALPCREHERRRACAGAQSGQQRRERPFQRAGERGLRLLDGRARHGDELRVWSVVRDAEHGLGLARPSREAARQGILPDGAERGGGDPRWSRSTAGREGRGVPALRGADQREHGAQRDRAERRG